MENTNPTTPTPNKVDTTKTTTTPVTADNAFKNTEPSASANTSANTLANPASVATAAIHRLLIQCAIRRKQGLIGLPGADPAERSYKLGAALDIKTSKNLKGVEGIVEKKLLPVVIGNQSTDFNFQKEVDNYWGNIGVLIPVDESYQKEDEKGKLIKIELLIKGEVLKKQIENETDIQKKVEYIIKGIEEDLISFSKEAYVPDFLLLCFALKNKEVAKDITLVHNSPRIKYYIFNKSTAVKQRMNIIDLKAKATEVFAAIKKDDAKINALLVMFDKLPTDYDDTMDKYIALDEEYSKSPEAMQKFINFAKDEDLELKFLIKMAHRKGKLTNPVNTDAYYYNQVLLGVTLEESVLYLKQDNVEAKNIKDILQREIKEQ